MKIDFNFELDQKISSGLCFLLILLLSAVFAWYTVRVAEKIIENPPQAIVKSAEE